MPKKENNRRRYPGESSYCRPDKAKMRREKAQERQELSNKLSSQQKLAKLDQKFGKDQGATKERQKLLKKIDAAKEKPTHLSKAVIPEEILKEIESINEENSSKKKLKAKERRKFENRNN